MSVTPDFVGQRYKDTNTGNIWIANSTTPGDWTLELQNMRLKWTPRNVDLSKLVGPAMGIDASVGSYIIEAGEIDYYLVISNESLLTSVSLPNCVTALDIGVNANSLLTTFSAPLLETVNGIVDLHGNAFVSLSLPSFINAGNGISAAGNSSLSSVSLPMFLPSNGISMNFANCALTTSAVDHILSRAVASAVYVSGTIDISGGTNQPPSQGGSDPYDILTARGVSISKN